MSTTTPNLGLFKYDPSSDGAQTFNIQKALNENWDKVDAAVKALSSAAEYSAAQTYALGDYCTHDWKLYRCTTAITEAEAWNQDHWTETSVTAELIAIYTALQNKADGGKKSEWMQDGSAFSRNGIDYFRDDTGTVYVSCYNTILAESIPAWTLKQIAMLPEGFRPLQDMATTIRHDGNRCSSINFYSTGQISIQTYDLAAGATAISFFISFPTE